MEHIKLALEKAQASRERVAHPEIVDDLLCPPVEPEQSVSRQHVTFSSPCTVQLDPEHLENNRVVSYLMTDPSHIAFNILRTKIFAVMGSNGWKSIAVSSPGPGCGKTMVTINLALSLARQANCKTVLVDLDLRRPTVAKTLGIPVDRSLLDYLVGTGSIEDSFVKIGDNLIVLLNDQPVRNSSEVMLLQRCRTIAQKLSETLAPDIILFDLPPILSSDDAIGFLPCVDASMLVIAEGTSTYKEVDECDRKLNSLNGFLGHILNKSSDQTEMGYQYYGM